MSGLVPAVRQLPGPMYVALGAGRGTSPSHRSAQRPAEGRRGAGRQLSTGSRRLAITLRASFFGLVR